MEDVLDVYKRPYNSEYPVVCMDETNKQLISETITPLPSTPGRPARFDTAYERNGVSNVFLSFEPLSGKRKIKVTDSRTKKDWAYFIKELVDEYKNAKKILLVMDNLNTHTGSSLYETFLPNEAKNILDKLEIHHTPKHGSWLNVAEIELSNLSRQCLNRRIPNKETMIAETNAWANDRNNKNVKLEWQFTTEDARAKLKKLYPIQVELSQT